MFDYTGFGEQALTFSCEGEVKAGCPVTVCGNDTVCASADSDVFAGVAATVRGSTATVIMSGFVRLPFSGTAPALGVAGLASDGNGGVKVADEGRTVTVLNVDGETSTVGFIF